MNTSLRLNHYGITCADGFETLLPEELEQLATKVTQRKPKRLIIAAKLEHASRICMWSLLPPCVLLPIPPYVLERPPDDRFLHKLVYAGA
ncbi:23S rRNA (guanine(2445)-N(2))/(guanine(2069)-N(7))-methyltransferase, partial [Acinetobacter baumannii]|nr:23S rRNA (guanine(2445)-N(2))/(guanine(2069)-N(7))-methyltransferase [Acinetobacter baumannii]